MQSEHVPNAISGESEAPSGPALPTAPKGFKITPQDARFLIRERDNYEKADTKGKTKILGTCVGECYKLRPGNESFDKKQAKEVFFRIVNPHIYAF